MPLWEKCVQCLFKWLLSIFILSLDKNIRIIEHQEGQYHTLILLRVCIVTQETIKPHWGFLLLAESGGAQCSAFLSLNSVYGTLAG